MANDYQYPNEKQEVIQITKYQTNKALIAAVDNLKYEKIRFNCLDYSKGTGENTVNVYANIDRVDFLVLSQRILNGVNFGLSQSDGSKVLLYQNKILSYNTDKDTGLAPVTILTVTENNPTMKLKYKISVSNGTAIPIKTETNGVSAKKGSFKQQKFVQVFLSEWDMCKFLMSVSHYIKCKEYGKL